MVSRERNGTPLLQGPSEGLLHELEAIPPPRSAGGFLAHHPSLSNIMFASAAQNNLDNRTLDQRRHAVAHKPFSAHVFGSSDFLECFSTRFSAPQSQAKSHADTDVGALLRPLALQFHGEPVPEFIEFERLLKVRNGAEVRAVVLIYFAPVSPVITRIGIVVAQGAKALA